MSPVRSWLRKLDLLFPPQQVFAHCDIPCGIYDPHLAQIGALTVVRMNQLIEGLQKPDDGASKADLDKYEHSLARYIAVKEEHAELVKREVRIIWGDYFRPEHAQQNPELHNMTWNIMKLASQGRQQINMQASQDLLTEVQKFAEAFWQTKNVPVKRQPSNQTVGGEIVVPTN